MRPSRALAGLAGRARQTMRTRPTTTQDDGEACETPTARKGPSALRPAGHGGDRDAARRGLAVRGPHPRQQFPLPPATHPDRRLQLGYKLVVESPCHLRLQLVDALVAVGEPLKAGGREKAKASAPAGAALPLSQGSVPCHRPGWGRWLQRLSWPPRQSPGPPPAARRAPADPGVSPSAQPHFLVLDLYWASNYQQGLRNPTAGPPPHPQLPTRSWAMPRLLLGDLQHSGPPCRAGLGQGLWRLRGFLAPTGPHGKN